MKKTEDAEKVADEIAGVDEENPASKKRSCIKCKIELASDNKLPFCPACWEEITGYLKKLDKPLQTVNELSETIDLVHEASRNAVRSVLVTIIENASSIKDWTLSKKRTAEERSEQVQEVDSDGR